MNLIQWIHHFKVSYIKDDEYCIECPACGRDKLYFNVKKKLGHCHLDACKFHTSPATVNALSDYSGFFPDEHAEFNARGPGSAMWTSVTSIPSYRVTYKREVNLPETAKPLVLNKKGKLKTYFPGVVKEVSKRISAPLQYMYNLHFDGIRIYIPVYHEAKLVAYVGRAAWWFEHEYLRYEYPKGINITDYLFNWDKIGRSSYSTLYLVENTFNSIRYSTFKYNWTSTFGSHLSDRQIKLITDSLYSRVVFFWDGGTDFKAATAVDKLRNRGIGAGYISFPDKTQPDDFPDAEIMNLADVAVKKIDKGERSFKVTL